MKSVNMREIFSFMLVLNAISGAISFTVTVKRVQNQSPSYYRYSPEVFISGVHRVTTPTPHMQERLHIVRIPKYRRKYRYRVKNKPPVIYPMVVAQRPRSPPPKKHHEIRPLPTIVSNEVDQSKEEYLTETDFPPVSVDDGVSFPSFGKDSPHQAIRKPEEWPTPSPTKDPESAFTPVQMYLQIRQTNQVKHVPQSEALKDATTLEEVVNAPRLKELLRTTRVREVYSEEGYEDAGYDHGGHIRHAEHEEGFVAQDEGVFKLKESVKDEDYTIPEASLPKPKKTQVQSTETTKEKLKKQNQVPDEEEAQESKLEPKISRSRSEVTSIEFATLPSRYNGQHKYSSKIRSRNPDENSERKKTTESGFWSMPTVFDVVPSPTSPMGFDAYTLPSTKQVNDATEGTTQRSKFIKIIASSEEPTKTTIPNSSTAEMQKSRNKGFKYSRLHAKYPKHDRFRLTKLNQMVPTSEKVETSPEAEDKRIIVPTIGYINSLTTAHFGKNKTGQVSQNNNLLTTPLNLTQALNYLRSNRQHPVKTVHRKMISEDSMNMKNFEAKKLKKRNRRGLDGDEEEEEHEEDIPDDGEEVHNAKNTEIEDEERLRLEGENEDTEYEKKLKEELDKEEEEIVKATIGKYESKDDGEVLELLKEAYGETTTGSVDEEIIYVTTVKPIDVSKYPFYFSRQVNVDSPLRYATNPKNFPRKKGRGMVFYQSREKLVQCPEVRPDLSDIPKKNATLETEGRDNSRLAGLGDKIACLRAKYFDEDPLDNPLFKEKEIDYVGRIKYRTEKKNMTGGNFRKGRNSYVTIRKKPVQLQNTTQREQPEKLRYHSSYQYQPNSTIHIMVQGRQKNASGKERIIPVTENVDETPLQSAAYSRITGLTPPPLRRKFVRPSYHPFTTSTPTPTHLVQSKLVIPHNCMHVISKMAALNGHKNLIIECNDATLMQELRNDVRFLKIIPKIPDVQKNKSAKTNNAPFESTDWVPMTTYPTIPRFGRKTDGNESEHYLITELKEEEDVRKGEVVEEKAKSNETVSFDLAERSNRRRRAVHEDRHKTTNGPLRLSLKEFFLLLQKGNGRNRFSPKPFQLPSTTPKPPESLEDEEVVKIGGQYIKGTNGREFIYIKLHPTSVGRWVVREATPETGKYTKKTFKNTYKKYGKGKL